MNIDSVYADRLMQAPIISPYPISDFVEWEFSGQLVLTPLFQRGDVWPPKAKSYLIDTILRLRLVPPIYIRLKFDSERKRTLREVVDGQQRLRAVLGFIKGEFPVLRIHNTEFGGLYYDQLPEDVRDRIRSYKFNVTLLENLSDLEIHEIFMRINTYTVPANAQELRNARYFGAFKQTMYKLALDHYTFWRSNNILSDQKITRMADAELVSELAVTMLDGIRQTKTADLNEFYKEFDEAFPQAEKVIHEFDATIDIIGEIFEDSLRETQYKRIPLFYSLFTVIYDAKFGLPDSDRPRLRFTSRENRVLADIFHNFSYLISLEEPPDEFRSFLDASRLSTADVGKRRLRHDFLWGTVLMSVANAVSAQR